MSQPQITPGTLYCVATPIGNLQDITFRAIEVLTQVDLILAEDTRHSGKLLNHYQIATPMRPLHDHNERKAAEAIVRQLQEGNSMALISDAGTPLVSDPGFVLVRACIEVGINICSIPGPCAAISALVSSGLPMDQFYFVGFLPAKGQARQTALEALTHYPTTCVLYESGRRLPLLLKQIEETMGAARQVVLAKELTKTHEAIYRDEAAALLVAIEDGAISLKGEWVVCVAGHDAAEDDAQSLEKVKSLLVKLLPYYPLSDAVKTVVEITGVRKKMIYDLALKIQDRK